MEREKIIENILDMEWEMFTNTRNAEGRASCQDDRGTFLIMRRAQNEIWSDAALLLYSRDLFFAKKNQVNLMSIKYARMMEATFPEEYESIKDKLPELSPRVIELVDEIMKYHSKWAADASKRYPLLFSVTRPVTSDNIKNSNAVAIDNYLRCELLTCSEETLESFLNDTEKAWKDNQNLSMDILRNSAKRYGFDSLNDIEERLASRINTKDI